MPTTLVIGAGWAGLSCAYELAKYGHQVTILEAAPNIGGRARSVQFADTIVDNGQHIAIGSYFNMRNIIAELRLSEQDLFHILPLEVRCSGANPIHLYIPNLPFPFNLFTGLLRANLGAEKLQVLKFMYTLRKLRYKLPTDCSIEELLLNYNQSKNMIEHFWQPIAIAAMSTPISTASAQVFVNVLAQTFMTPHTNCKWYFPKIDLGALLPEKILQYLQRLNCQVLCNQAVKHLEIDNEYCMKVITRDTSWSCDNVVLATAPWHTTKLLATHQITNALSKKLSCFNPEQITTIYLQYSKPIRLTFPMQALQNTISQWVFDRSFAAQPNILSVVITGKIPEQYKDNAQLVKQVIDELITHKIQVEPPISYKVIREKQAAFACTVLTQKFRPVTTTPVKNLWLCGDYLNTGLPATLEGALLSGKETAKVLTQT